MRLYNSINSDKMLGIMSATLHECIRERQQLANELDQLDDRARKVREAIATIDNDLSKRFSALAQALGGEPEPAPRTAIPVPVIRPSLHPVGGADIDHWIQIALMNECRPLKPKQIFDTIRGMGTAVSGKDPVNNISARLSYSDRFYKLANGSGWWIHSEPLPGAQAAD